MINTINNINPTNMLTDKTDAEASREKRAKELKEACSGFEGMFLSMMMKSMRQASSAFKSGLVETSKGEEIFTEMLDQEYVTVATKSDSTGLGNMLYEHIINSTEEYADLRNGGAGAPASTIDSNISKLHRLKQEAIINKDKGIGLDFTY